MSVNDQPVRQAISIDISDEGLAATHPVVIDFPRAVAPSAIGSKEHNTLRDFLVVVGCAMFPDVTFQFDSSLVGPDVKKATKRLALFRDQLKEKPGLKDGEADEFPPIALFGHADPEGRRDYNSKLSARRAMCIYGMLLGKPEIWEDLFKDKSVAGDVWGDPEFDTMLDEVGFAPDVPPGGGGDPEKRAEVKKKLKASPSDSKGLFSNYINAVCVQDDGKGGTKPFVLVEKDFLDGGERFDHKAAVQGCGEFNPVKIISDAKHRRFEQANDKEGRNAENEPNRRVLAFFFKPGTKIVADKWPCPAFNEKDPVKACTKRLWKDAESRRLKPTPGPDEEVVDPKDPSKKKSTDRFFKETADTFGCRFYHGFAQNSPCEGTLKLWVLRLGLDDDLKADDKGKVIVDDKGRTQLNHPIARRRYVVEMAKDPGAPLIRGRTDEQGGIRLPMFDEKTTMTLKLDLKTLVDPGDKKKSDEQEKDTPEEEFKTIVLRGGELLEMRAPDDPQFDVLAVRQRLSNLSFGPDLPVAKWTADDEKKALTLFQRKHKLTESGTADAATVTELRKVHGS